MARPTLPALPAALTLLTPRSASLPASAPSGWTPVAVTTVSQGRNTSLTFPSLSVTRQRTPSASTAVTQVFFIIFTPRRPSSPSAGHAVPLS